MHIVPVLLSIGSPSREWTFIDSSEVAEASGPMVSNSGAIPKRSTPPSAENAGNSTNVDYAELSRLLSTHFDAQKKDAATPAAQPQIEDKIEPEVTDITAKTTKTPPPTPLHPGLYHLNIFYFSKKNLKK